MIRGIPTQRLEFDDVYQPADDARRVKSLVVAAIVAAAVLVAPTSASAAPAEHATTGSTYCRITYFPNPGSTAGTCLQTGTGAPSNTIYAGACVYQNGGYGTSAWASGWMLCFFGPGTFLVPVAYNDKASSWDTGCTGGTFYTNQPGTTPNANFPSLTSGNFPWGGVANDALSSLTLTYGCY